MFKEFKFIVTNCAMVEIDADICHQLMSDSCSGQVIGAGVVIALELIACDAVKRLQELLSKNPVLIFEWSNEEYFLF